jgi:hypothetical protein
MLKMVLLDVLMSDYYDNLYVGWDVVAISEDDEGIEC